MGCLLHIKYDSNCRLLVQLFTHCDTLPIYFLSAITGVGNQAYPEWMKVFADAKMTAMISDGLVTIAISWKPETILNCSNKAKGLIKISGNW
jgi:hypothetical protein